MKAFRRNASLDLTSALGGSSLVPPRRVCLVKDCLRGTVSAI